MGACRGADAVLLEPAAHRPGHRGTAGEDRDNGHHHAEPDIICASAQVAHLDGDRSGQWVSVDHTAGPQPVTILGDQPGVPGCLDGVPVHPGGGEAVSQAVSQAVCQGGVGPDAAVLQVVPGAGVLQCGAAFGQRLVQTGDPGWCLASVWRHGFWLKHPQLTTQSSQTRAGFAAAQALPITVVGAVVTSIGGDISMGRVMIINTACEKLSSPKHTLGVAVGPAGW